MAARATYEGEFQWIRPPVQARSQASLNRILDAAEEVIAERGFAKATVAEIVRRAKSSVGVFYDRLRDKDSLLDCLHLRFCEQAYATADVALAPERWQGASIEQILEKLMAFLVLIYRENKGIMRAFLVRAGTDAVFGERAMQLHSYLSERLAGLLDDHQEKIRHPQPAWAVEFGLRVVGSTLDNFALFEEVDDPRARVADDVLAEQLTRVFLSFLGVEVVGKRRPRREPAIAE